MNPHIRFLLLSVVLLGLAGLKSQGGGTVSILTDFEFQTIAQNGPGLHENFEFMQEHIVVDLPFDEIGSFELLIRESSRAGEWTHEPYQDNYCNVAAEPLGTVSLFTVVCSRRLSEAGGGYVLPATARLQITRRTPKLRTVEFDFGTIAANGIGFHDGYDFMQQHIEVADLPFDRVDGYKFMIREGKNILEPHLDNYCSVGSEPLGTGSLFTVICGRQRSESAGGYMLPSTARLIILEKSINHSLTDFAFGTVVSNTLAFHHGYDFIQAQIELVDLPFGRIGSYKFLVLEDSSTHEPSEDNYCNVAAQPLGSGSLFTVICSRQRSESSGGYMLPDTGRLLIQKNR